MPARTIEDLPNELISMILSSSNNPQDLLALIRCSTILYRNFRASWTEILATVIRSAFGSVQYDAVAACEASLICRTYVGNPSDELYKRQVKFLRKYQSQSGIPRRLNLQQPSLLISLSKLWWLTNDFANIFKVNAFKQIEHYIPLIEPGHTHPLTALEETRIRRAFVRCEIYRKLFVDDVVTDNRNPQGYDGLEPMVLFRIKFYQILPPWEREELICVKNFLLEFVRGLQKELESHIAKRLYLIAIEKVTQMVEPGCPLKRANTLMVRSWLDANYSSIVGHSPDFQNDTAECIASRGLPFIRWLSRLTLGDRISVFRTNEQQRAHRDMLDPLINIHDDHPNEKVPTHWPWKGTGSDIDSPSEGWRKARSQRLTSRADMIVARDILRRLGYVFWDHARIERDWDFRVILNCIFDKRPHTPVHIESVRPFEPDNRRFIEELCLPQDLFEDGERLRRLVDSNCNPSASMGTVANPLSEGKMYMSGSSGIEY